MGRLFACAHCGAECESDADWGDAEAEAEATDLWGGLDSTTGAVICDDCHEAFLAWMAARGFAPGLDGRVRCLACSEPLPPDAEALRCQRCGAGGSPVAVA